MLSAFAALLAMVVAPRLANARWVLRAPRLAVFAWLALSYAVVVSAALISFTSVLHWDHAHPLLCTGWRICSDALRGEHGRFAQAVAVCGLFLLTTLTVRIGVGGWRLVAAERRQRRQLMLILQFGVPAPALSAVVVPCPRPDAYLLPGRRSHIVLTSAAVEQLTPGELRAVLAHERAHATGRHYWLLRLVQLPMRAFPGVAVFAVAGRQVHRLVELCADDVATRTSRPLALARALVTMAGGRAAAPQSTLRVDGGNTAERLGRLLQPPAPLSRTSRAVIAVALLVAPTAPVWIVLLDRYIRWSVVLPWPL